MFRNVVLVYETSEEAHRDERKLGASTDVQRSL